MFRLSALRCRQNKEINHGTYLKPFSTRRSITVGVILIYNRLLDMRSLGSKDLEVNDGDSGACGWLFSGF